MNTKETNMEAVNPEQWKRNVEKSLAEERRVRDEALRLAQAEVARLQDAVGAAWGHLKDHHPGTARAILEAAYLAQPPPDAEALKRTAEADEAIVQGCAMCQRNAAEAYERQKAAEALAEVRREDGKRMYVAARRMERVLLEATDPSVSGFSENEAVAALKAWDEATAEPAP